jgi:hypothetical protein
MTNDGCAKFEDEVATREAAGIEFTNGDVPGVRLRKKKR